MVRGLLGLFELVLFLARPLARLACPRVQELLDSAKAARQLPPGAKAARQPPLGVRAASQCKSYKTVAPRCKTCETVQKL